MSGQCLICYQSDAVEPFAKAVCHCEGESFDKHLSCLIEWVIDSNNLRCPQCRKSVKDWRIQTESEYSPSVLEYLSFPLSLRRVIRWFAINLLLAMVYYVFTDSRLFALIPSVIVIFNGITLATMANSFRAHRTQDMRYVRFERSVFGRLVATTLDTFVWHFSPKPQRLANQPNRSATGQRCLICSGDHTEQKPLTRVCRCADTLFHPDCLVAHLVNTLDEPCPKCGTRFTCDRLRREPTFWQYLIESPMGGPFVLFQIMEVIGFCIDMTELWYESPMSDSLGRKPMSGLAIELVIVCCCWLFSLHYTYPTFYAKQKRKTIVYQSKTNNKTEVHKIILVNRNY